MKKFGRMKRHQGFTLIEAMITVVILGIVTAIAIPSFQGSLRKSRRADATTALAALQLAQEKYRANNATYGTLAQLNLSSTTSNGYYTLSVSGNDAVGYTLTATAASGTSQAYDTGCTAMTLTQAGATTTYGPTNVCWSR